MPARPQHAAEQVAAALRQHHGLVTYAARSLDVSPQTVRNHLKRSALVRQALSEAREATLDAAEDALFRAVHVGDA
jgi:hypothetical protein